MKMGESLFRICIWYVHGWPTLNRESNRSGIIIYLFILCSIRVEFHRDVFVFIIRSCRAFVHNMYRDTQPRFLA